MSKLKKTPGTKKKFPIGTDVEKKYIGQENPLFPIMTNTDSIVSFGLKSYLSTTDTVVKLSNNTLFKVFSNRIIYKMRLQTVS